VVGVYGDPRASLAVCLRSVLIFAIAVLKKAAVQFCSALPWRGWMGTVDEDTTWPSPRRATTMLPKKVLILRSELRLPWLLEM